MNRGKSIDDNCYICNYSSSCIWFSVIHLSSAIFCKSFRGVAIVGVHSWCSHRLLNDSDDFNKEPELGMTGCKCCYCRCRCRGTLRALMIMSMVPLSLTTWWQHWLLASSSSSSAVLASTYHQIKGYLLP